MKIGALVPRSGPAGLWGPSCEAGALLAAAEINTAGGVHGCRVDLVVADAGWTAAEADEAAAGLIDLDGVDAILGMHPSSTRAAVVARIAGRMPYIYTPQYEGGERGRMVVATGATDAEVLRPSVPWLVEHRRARRFFLVSSDYVWPLSGQRTAARIIAASGARVVGEATLGFGADPTATLDAIRACRPDTVLMFLLGHEAVRFNRAFAAEGLAVTMLRFALGVDETVLLGIGADNAENLHVASRYLASLRSPDNQAFLERYRDAFGLWAVPMNVFGRSCYDGVHLLARMAAPALDAAGRVRFAPPRHRCGREDHATRPVHVAVAEGLALRVLASSP